MTCKSLWLCGSQQTVEISSRDGNTRPPYLSPEKSVCKSKSKLESDVDQWTGSKLEKEYIKLYIVILLFNLYAEYIMWNARLDEAQAGIKIAGRNINNLRYAYDTTLMAESEEELKRLLMKVKEESERAGLKLNIQKTKITASSPITSWQIDGKTMTDYFLGLQNHCRWWLKPWN